jgi:hypothetical protein
MTARLKVLVCMQAAAAMEALFMEISTWALAMPSYSSPLCGIATTMLTLLHDRCDSAFRSLLQQQPHLLALLDRQSVVDALESEPGLRCATALSFVEAVCSTSARAASCVLRLCFIELCVWFRL